MRSSFLALALALASVLQASVEAANTFAGDFTRVSVSPSECVAPSTCEYLCSATYTITVQRSTATIYPTANPPSCACTVLRASIADNTATGSTSGSKFSLTLTPAGINAISTLSGLTCTARYVASGTASSDSQVVGNTPAGATTIISSNAALSTHARPQQIAWVIVLTTAFAAYNF